MSPVSLQENVVSREDRHSLEGNLSQISSLSTQDFSKISTPLNAYPTPAPAPASAPLPPDCEKGILSTL